MNIHTKPERKRKCRRPEITAHNTWRPWETVMMILSEAVLSCRAPSSFSPAEAVWGSGTVVWAGTEDEPAEDWCRCWFEPHCSLQDSTDKGQRSTGPKWRTPAPRSHKPNSPDPSVSRSEKTCQSTWVLNLCCSSVFTRMNEWMNEWIMHLYSALLCIAVHPKRFTIMWWGVLLKHHQCAASTWIMRRLPQDNGASALTTHQLQVERRERHRANQVYVLTTHQLQVERRKRHRDDQVYALTTHQLQVERRESHRVNQVYVLTTHQLQVERRESHRDNQVYALTKTPATGGEGTRMRES